MKLHTGGPIQSRGCTERGSPYSEVPYRGGPAPFSESVKLEELPFPELGFPR